MDADERDALLIAIAKARAWIDDLIEGRVASFAEIARHEGKVERHIRFLAPLAFVSPAIISNIIAGDAAPIKVTELAKKTAYCWNQQNIDRPSG
jgi:site-specific DNA recombinase